MIANKIKLLSVLMIAPAAFGSIVYQDTVDLGGTGLGAVETILTQNNNTGTSEGCIAFVNGADRRGDQGGCSIGGLTGGDEQNGQTQTQLLGAVDTIGDAYDIAIIFNAVEPQGQGQGTITLDALNLILYGGNGMTFEASLAAGDVGRTFDAFAGTGNSGFRFVLDDMQAAMAQTFLETNGLTIDQVRIGLSAAVSNEQGGNETFFLASVDRTPPQGGGEIPEPATLGLMGGALVGLAAFRIRKTR